MSDMQQQPSEFTGEFVFTEETVSSVPVGQYPVTFAGIESCDTEFGRKARLMWTVTAGEQQGQIASTLCGIPKRKLNPSHTLYQFLVAFLGRQPVEEERIDFKRFIGSPGTVIVSPTQTGKGTKVTAFLPSQPAVQQTVAPAAPQPMHTPQRTAQPLSQQPARQQPTAYAEPLPQQDVQQQHDAWQDTQQQVVERFE